jgi:hypothetical protein
MMVLAIASLITAPAGAAAPMKQKSEGAGASQLSGNSVKHLDDSPKSVEPILYPRTNYVWPYSTGPVYAAVDAESWKTDGVFHTAVGSFDLKRGTLPGLPNELRASNKLAAGNSQYFVLQVDTAAFTDGTWDQMKSAINAHGGVIVGQVPVGAFYVKMNKGVENALRDFSRSIIGLLPYQPAFKLSPSIGQVPLPNPERAVSNLYTLQLQLFRGEKYENITGDLNRIGARVISAFGDALYIEVDRSKLADVAAIDQVFLINEVLPTWMFSEETSTVIQTGKWSNGATPYTDAGVDGGGLDKVSQTDDQILMIIDNGIEIDAGDLSHTKTSSGFDASLSAHVIANHRKIAFYGTSVPFGGTGDLLGCDSPTTSGVTHGHTVAVVALGNATRVDLATYDPTGDAWHATDASGLSWGLDGVAPKARLVAYDAQVTPFFGRCDDITQITGTLGTANSVLDPGPNLYTAPSGGPLADGYAKGARISNFSWGKVNPDPVDAYTTQVDSFLVDFPDAMVFVAAGNNGRDKNGDRIPDPSTVGSPAQGKNVISVGASSNADDLGDKDLVERRWPNSSNGPASALSQRIAPLLMAPGTDAGGQGLASEYHCRSNRNDNLEPVSCDVIAGQISTSFASGAAAGAGLLVRDYFSQGFYPDGTNTNATNTADKISTISGALLKAMLVASADWMNQPGTLEAQKPQTAQFGQIPDFFGFTGNLTRKFRGNREQGFGRIQLTNVLPLTTSPQTITGLIIGDGGPAPAGLKNDTTLSLNLAAGASTSTTVNVCDNTQPLTVVIAWTDPSANDRIVNDLDLEVISPVTTTSTKYLGNFFTDDISDNGVIGGDATDTGEECTYTGYPWPADSVAGVVDTGPWSLPLASNCKNSCSVASQAGPPPIFKGCTTNTDCSGLGVCSTRSAHVDRNNNVEAVFLSPDTKLNGIVDDGGTSTINESADNQIEQGTWTINVKAAAGNSSSQRYSIVIAGGVCLGSAARIQKVLPDNQLGGSSLTCNDSAVVTIDEIGTGGDPLPSAATVASRTSVQVLDSGGSPVDTETLAATDFTLVGSCSLAPTKSCTSNSDCTVVPNQGTCLLSPGNNLRYESKKILLTDGTTPQSGNGALDVRDGQRIRVTYQDANPSATRTGTASVNCRPQIASGGVLFAQFGKDAFTLVDGGCERDERQPVGYFTFGFPDRYMDNGEIVQYLLAFQSAEIGTDLLNAQVSLKAVFADTNSPASCRMGTAPTAACPDPDRLNNVCASSTPTVPCGTAVMTILDSPKVFGRIPAGTTLTPAFTISLSMAETIQNVDMIVGVTATAAGKGVETQFAKRETLNVDEVSLYYSTDFPTGGTESVGGYDINNNEILETVTYDPRNFFTDYFYETRTYSDLTSTNPTLVALGAPWNFDTLDGGFRNGLNNTSRPQPLSPMSQWSEDKNFNGRLDGFCTTDNDIPCTQGIPKSQGCQRCSLNHATECSINADCQPPIDPLGNEGTCTYNAGTCNFALNEDRNINGNNTFDKSWNTLGGCGWQTKFPGAAGGGVWHTGLIRDTSATDCVAAGSLPGKCQQYWIQDDGDTVGDNNWWDLLLTPVLHKVNQQVTNGHCSVTTGTACTLSSGCPVGETCIGDPVYQASITDWAWNMLVDIPDTNTQVTMEFDTDINKTAGSELFNDATILVQFRGKQGPVSGGNAPITNGFNMFHRINACVDTDGNGSVDHCGTSQGKLCSADGVSTPSNFFCDGNDTRLVRGLCTTPTTLPGLRCTGNTGLGACTTNADCNKHCSTKPDTACITNTTCTIAGGGVCIDNHPVLAGDRCVRPFIECSTNADCASVGGTCAVATGADLARNREGSNNCYFHGIGGGVAAGNHAHSAEPYGLPTPNDDDTPNGYCSRSDSFNGLDKSVSCESVTDCNAAGAPYATVRTCSLWKSCSRAPAKGCLNNADCFLPTEGFCDATKPLPCTKDSPDCGAGLANGANPVGGVCTGVTFTAVCNLPNGTADEYVQKNGPGRNYGVQVSNGPDLRFSTLEDIYGDTGNDFQAALGFNNREPDPLTKGIPAGYGLAVDDMVVSWKETRLDLDTHTCSNATGECATLDTASTLAYEGNAVVSLTVVDKVPYEPLVPARNKNDCNGDGDYTDIGKCSSRAKGCTAASECFSCSLAPTKSCATNLDCQGQCTVGGTICTTTADCGAGVCSGSNGTCVTTDTCNADPAYVDDQDCNNNGTLDVTVGMTSDAETVPEIAILDETSAGSHVYKANFPYSTLYNSPGSLFVLQSGTSLPVVTARYADRDDGTGLSCKNNVDPLVAGIVTSQTTVAATSGLITLNSYSVGNVSTCSGNTSIQCNKNSDCSGNGFCNWCSNNTSIGCALDADCGAGNKCISATGHGDPDGFADANEMIDLSIVLANKSGLDVDDITATLGTTSPNIECITRASIFVGSLKNKELSNPANYLPFQFKVKSTANRTDPFATLQAKFTLTIRSSKFDALTRATEFSIDLDLNASGGGATSAFFEGFETDLTQWGKFTREFLDANKRSRVLSKGYRCQYNNPFGVNSQSASNQDCFLGFTSDPSSGKNDWHIHASSTDSKVGRAFEGVQSLHLGVHLDTNTPTQDTTRLKHIMSIKTITPINIPLAGAGPQLNFAQQVSFVDSSAGVNVSPGEGVDRGVVEVQRNLGVTPQGSWIKIFPFENGYDQQGTDDFSNCEFDPVDDGNTETDFFDPADPNRRLGPSSTCFPEFCFVHQGQTDYRKSFDQTDIGNASDGPGLQGCSGVGCLPANTPTVIANPGTWVRPRFDLVNFAASSINLRFLFTSIEVATTETMFGFFGRGDLSGDDGWFIDDIHIDQALDTPLTLSVDTVTIASPIACGNCSLITANLDTDPTGLSSVSSPGQIVTLTAKASTADRCINGILQYQFWNDVNQDGVVGVAPDTLLRDWTDNANFVAAPLVTTQYGVKVRCSTELSCTGAVAANTMVLKINVACPGGPFPETVRVNRAGTMASQLISLNWNPPNVSVDIIRGSLTGTPVANATKTLLATSPNVGFNNSVTGCLVNNSAPINTFAEPAPPLLAPGDGYYYVIRGQLGQKYTSGSVKERGGPAGGFCNGTSTRDTELAADADACNP